MALKGLGNVKKAINALVDKANDDLRGIYFAGLQDIIQQTPTGLTRSETGRASTSGTTRNGWRLTLNEPSSQKIKTASKNGAKSFQQLNKMPHYVLGKKIFFTNNADHINVLEYGGYPKNVKKGSRLKDGSYIKLSRGGYSKPVAPNGWVRVTIKLMEQKIGSL